MPTEGADHIADFNSGLPEGSTDQVLIVDDHFNMIKAALLRDINGFVGSALIFGESTHSSNVYPVSLSISPLTYEKGMTLIMRALNANTDAVDINVASLGAQNLLMLDGTELAAGYIQAGDVVVAVYNGTEFRLVSVSMNYVETYVAAQIAVAPYIPPISPAVLDNAVVQNTDGTLADAGAPLLTIAYEETSAVAWNKQSTTVINHTLGVAPQFITPVLVCTSGNNGYSIGDEFVTNIGCQSGDSQDNNLANVALAVEVGATSFKLACYMRTSTTRGGFNLSPKTGGDSTNGDLWADPTEWDIKFRLLAVAGTIAAGT